MPVLKIYRDDTRLDLIAVYSGFPWEWDCRTKYLTVWTTKSDGIQYKCESMDYNDVVYRAYQSVLPKEEDEEDVGF